MARLVIIIDLPNVDDTLVDPHTTADELFAVAEDFPTFAGGETFDVRVTIDGDGPEWCAARYVSAEWDR